MPKKDRKKLVSGFISQDRDWDLDPKIWDLAIHCGLLNRTNSNGKSVKSFLQFNYLMPNQLLGPLLSNEIGFLLN